MLNPERSLDRTVTRFASGAAPRPTVPGFNPLPVRRTPTFRATSNGFASYDMVLTKWNPSRQWFLLAFGGRYAEIQHIDALAHSQPRPWQQ